LLHAPFVWQHSCCPAMHSDTLPTMPLPCPVGSRLKWLSRKTHRRKRKCHPPLPQPPSAQSIILTDFTLTRPLHTLAVVVALLAAIGFPVLVCSEALTSSDTTPTTNESGNSSGNLLANSNLSSSDL